MNASELLQTSSGDSVQKIRSNIPIIFLAGSGGGAPDLDVFRRGPDDDTHVEVIGYPHWSQFQQSHLSAQAIISDLATQIAVKIPEGPIRIIGHSIGGHLGYGVGIHLQARGRALAGLCAIDSFMFASSEAASGWQRRALKQACELLLAGKGKEFLEFVRSRLWRLFIRLSGHRLAGFLSASGPSVATAGLDPILDKELSMRYLTQAVAAWMASVEREPVVLDAPVIFLRTAIRADDDAAWRQRCSSLEVTEIKGQHHSLFEPENRGALHDAFIAATRDWR